MRSYLMLKQKAKEWNANKEIQSILKELGKAVPGTPSVGKYSKKGAAALLGHEFNKDQILKKRLPYERLDQLTIDVLLQGC
jgi:xylose isomerase